MSCRSRPCREQAHAATLSGKTTDGGTKAQDFHSPRTTIDTAEEGVTFEEAQAVYVKARMNRAQSGFVHSFAPDYYGDKPYEYQFLAIEAPR